MSTHRRQYAQASQEDAEGQCRRAGGGVAQDPAGLLDQLVKGPMTAEAVDAASRAFKKALIERALGAEMSHHLGYPAGSEKPEAATNHRNGRGGKTVLTDH